MAIALPPDVVHPKDTHPAVAPWRLSRDRAQDLRDVACGLEESDVGIRTRYLFDEMEREHGRPAGFDHVPLHDVESFCDRFDVMEAFGVNQWRARIRRCRAAIRRMQIAGDRDHAAALHVVHGPRCPFVRALDRQVLDHLGELTPLLRYTATTEAARKALVREQLARSGHHGRPSAGGLAPLAVVVSLSDYRERERFLDRVTSSGDAVRTALAAFADPAPRPQPQESRSAFDTRQRSFADRSRAHADRRRAFLDEGRADADAMLTRASRAFHAAWLASAAD